MTRDEKCKACGAVLFRKVPLDAEGENWAVLDEDYKQMESVQRWQNDKEYYECPQCKKKNWISGFSEPGKGRKIWISHVTD